MGMSTHAVVTKKVPPYAIVGGNPAKLKKLRFSENQIADFIAISWWNWGADKIKSRVEQLCSEKIEILFSSTYPKFKLHEG